jgi:hypothetical protein
MASISGGDKLRDALNKIAAKLDKGGTLKVGFLSGATDTEGMSIPLKAALNEFGHTMPNGAEVPPRPFFRNMIQAKAKNWPDAIAGQLKATNYDVNLTLQRAGAAIKGQLQESILDLWSPELSEVTVKKKGFEKPLIEKGDMINAAAWEVNASGKGSQSAAEDNASSFAAGAAKATKPK